MNFITSYWRELLIVVLILSLSVTLFVLYKRPTVTVTVEDTKQIESLRTQVDQLTADLKKSQAAYDNRQKDTVTKIKIVKEQNAKEIDRLSKLTTAGRDSVWSSIKTY